VDRNGAKERGHDLQVKEADLEPERSVHLDVMPLVIWCHGALRHNVDIVLYRIDHRLRE